MGAAEEDGDVQSFWTAFIPGVLRVPGSGSEEGGPRSAENDGSSPSALRRDAYKF